jgi:hypothetical protein
MPSGDNGHRTIKSAAYYYDEMTPEQRRCRGKRVHDFPDPDPLLDVLPEGYRVTGVGRQNYLITKECSRDCGMVRVEYTRWYRGHFVPTRKPGYLRPENWITAPRGVLTPAIIKQITMDRSHDLIVRYAVDGKEIPA